MSEFYGNEKGKTVRIYSDGKNGWCADSLLLLEPVAVGPGSTTLVKREVFEQIGGFDETKELHPSEDWEFCYRVAREFKLAFLSEILVEYRNHGGNGHLQIPRFERAMILAFKKIFSDDALEIQKLKVQSYGNLHKILAGSYFQNRHYGKFIKHSLKSMWLMPENIRYFLTFPLRQFRKSHKNKAVINEISLSNNVMESSLSPKLDKKRTMQKISVIIPTYNYAHFISEAIDSVLAQTTRVSEIIVVDDGSSDNIAEVVKTYGNRVKFIQQENRGAGAARNNGAKNASGELLAFLDADDVWHPNKLKKQIKYFRQDAEVGLVGCWMREFNESGETLLEYTEGKNGWCAQDILLIEPVVPGPGSTALIKREIFDKIGGFDERREMHAEDWEFCYRMARISKMAITPEILVNYRNHGGNKHLEIKKMERSIMLVYREIFSQADEETLKLRRKCYANAHTILASSYFQVSDYSAFFKHSVKAFWHQPQKIVYYLKFPWRRLKRSQLESS